MTKPDETLFSLQEMIVDLAFINRQHYMPRTDRRENDIEHSMAVAMLCWYICDTKNLDLDIAKVFKYALTHDFVERYAGDVPTFADKSERDNKVLCEQASLARLSKEYAGFSDLVLAMQNYEEKKDEEALFVWSVDKMQALILGDLDDWRNYYESDISYDQFAEKYAELLQKSSPHSKDIFSALIEYSKTTYSYTLKD